MSARTTTPEEQQTVDALIARARDAMRQAERYGQADVDRLIRAVAWAAGNEATAARLAAMSVDESGLGSPEPTRRAKILGILRDALRQKSMGVIEELPEKGDRQIREAGGRHRLTDSGDQSVCHSDRDRHLRHQVQRRRDLFAAPGEPENDERDGSGDASGAPRRGGAGRSVAVRRPSEYSSGAPVDEHL